MLTGHLFETNGREKALELIEEFRRKYPRRPAMLEETDKFLWKMEKGKVSSHQDAETPSK